mmetsp:Transcript_16891/g.53540  ORF Transcript_16891/g.53540 Transcript_16891/m.53540 type:complete len:233 (-) Transcript_16891:793-1491(-)
MSISSAGVGAPAPAPAAPPPASRSFRRVSSTASAARCALSSCEAAGRALLFFLAFMHCPTYACSFQRVSLGSESMSSSISSPSPPLCPTIATTWPSLSLGRSPRFWDSFRFSSNVISRAALSAGTWLGFAAPHTPSSPKSSVPAVATSSSSSISRSSACILSSILEAAHFFSIKSLTVSPIMRTSLPALLYSRQLSNTRRMSCRISNGVAYSCRSNLFETVPRSMGFFTIWK